MSPDRKDLLFMRRALTLAARGKGKTSPNPMVGAVVVKKGRIIGEGFHPAAGQPHAEVYALRAAGRGARGATMYVTLEPCCHTKKRTPPCVPELIRSGLRRVVVASEDPHSEVAGKGVALLRKAGIEVGVGLLRENARALNAAYFHFIKSGKPFVTLKVAATLDGRIAAPDGSSRWITGEAARRFVHKLRSESDAVMVGLGTVLADDPLLTARRRGGKNPIRIVVDSGLRISLKARVLHDLFRTKTILATTRRAPARKIEKVRALGAEVWVLPDQKGRVDLSGLMKRLGEEKIVNLLVEGGSRLSGALLREGRIDKLLLFLAPKLLGGDDGLPIFQGKGAARLSEAIGLTGVRWRRVGEDLFVEAFLPRS